jgi:hypothetical protein
VVNFDTPTGKVVVEALRWAVLAFVSALVTKLLELIPNANIDSNLSVYLTIFLRFVDAALHKSGVAEKGIVRF